MDILKFLRDKLVPPQTPVTPAEVKKVAGSKEDSTIWRTYGITNESLRQIISDQNLIIYERSNIYQVVDRCFTGDTKVALLDGRDVELRQLVEEYNQGKTNYVYSVDLEGRQLVRSPILWAKKIGHEEILKVVLDTGEEIKCTPDHKFMLRDGSYREAQYLQPNDSLMPLYRYVDTEKHKGYWRLYNPFNQHKNMPKEFCVQYAYFNKNRPKGSVVHHAFANFYNFGQNKLDDTPENHQIVTKKEHEELHRNLHAKESWVIKLKTTNYAKYLEWCQKIGITRKNKKIIPLHKGQTKATNDHLATVSRKLTGVKHPEERTFKSVVSQLQKNRNISREEAIKIYQFNRTMVPCPICAKPMDPHRKTCSYECKYKQQRQDECSVGLNEVRNHKVKEVIKLNVKEDVYCIRVEPFNNFALSAGVFVANSLNHALMSAACVAFADCACQRSPLHGSTVWVTSDNKEYRYQIEKMLDVINIEEVIYDWAWTTACFGDLFVEVFGEPGVGIVCVNDDNHPINVSRVDYNGRLIGFFQTPLGYATSDTRKLLAPWDHVHFRLLGAKKRRPLYQDQQYSEFRTVSIMTPDARRLTSKYGTSILADALPIWKRLRLAEDSIMMARIMKSPERYLFKVVIPEDNANAEAVASLVDQYQAEIKRARALNTDPNNPNYLDRFNAMASAEDLIFPVWGSSENLTVETLGGSTDIRWIADVDKLEDQLITALKVPKQLLAGFSGEGGGGFEGGTALERMDIRFARQARRIQRSLLSGITRMAQIHLAYQGMDPDLNLFQIHMSETSSAEEIELQDALGKSVDATRAFYELLDEMVGVDLDKKKLLEYFNEKFFKLSDLNIDELYLKGDSSKLEGDTRDLAAPGEIGGPQGEGEDVPETDIESPAPGEAETNPFRESKRENIRTSDLSSALPGKFGQKLWEATWSDKPISLESVPLMG